jgi:hypothetical protein
MLCDNDRDLEQKIEEFPERYCPGCGLDAGYMGIVITDREPDGYYCRKCLKVYISDVPNLNGDA